MSSNSNEARGTVTYGDGRMERLVLESSVGAKFDVKRVGDNIIAAIRTFVGKHVDALRAENVALAARVEILERELRELRKVP